MVRKKKRGQFKMTITPNIFLREKIVRLLVTISDGEGMPVRHYNYINMTESHLYKNMGIFEEIGLIRTEKIGRRKRVFLTEQGRQIAQDFKKIMRLMKK